MGVSEIEYGATDRIATVTLKRPERPNAFTFAMRGESSEDLSPGVPSWRDNPYRG
ncbi:hypothetical protein ACFOY2_21715 [Nonomuraea purpurea]|uniref:Enoyl-CoA hydratase n=1 Tax=Nonomuraea purpurea TaxID=1849276 RepID=A0ABV8GB05_9ACTN